MRDARGPAVRPLRGRRPWWILPIFGAVPAIDEGPIRILGLVAIGVLFEGYDLSMLMSSLSYIAADLGISESAAAAWIGIIRLGAIPAFLLVPLADRIGRRRMFLIAVAGMSLTTFLTAFSLSVAQFVVLQMVFRTFVLAAGTLAFVIVAEEFPAEHRGWGVGMLGAIGAAGFGLGALLFAFVDVLPYHWRPLYGFGVLPLLLLPRLRRGIPETARFIRHTRDHAERHDHPQRGAGTGAIRDWLAPIGELGRTYPLRVLGVTLAGGLYGAAETSVFQFCGYFTLTAHGWEPWQFSAMVLVAGALGMIGNVAAGRLGDALGRRPVGFAVATSFPVIAFLFYAAPGFWLPPLWSLLTICSVSTNTTIRALATEVFPTSHRGTAGGWLSLVGTLGAAAGLTLTGLGTGAGFALPAVVSTVSLLALVAAASLFLLPETSRLELEAIATER